jgi:hypothetical protein
VWTTKISNTCKFQSPFVQSGLVVDVYQDSAEYTRNHHTGAGKSEDNHRITLSPDRFENGDSS